MVRTLPNPHLLIALFVSREAVLSSRIEGTRASISDLVRFVVGWAVDVDRGIVFAVEEIWLRCTRLDQILSIAWRAKHEVIHRIKPPLLQLAVASLAQRHFSIEKEQSSEVARAQVAQLDGEAVVEELCRMLGADTSDSGARRHAEELLAAA